MSQQFDNTNRGALFRNDKRDNPKRPDYRGEINIEGREFWLSAWIRKKNDGSDTFMSISVEPKEDRAPAPSRTPITDHHRAKANAYVKPPHDPEDGEEIPF